MRTVTFSDRELAAYVNDRFVCAWQNRIPKFHDCDLGEEQRIALHKGEMFATRNIFTFLMEPREGIVLHYLSGHFAPAYYRDELEFANRLWTEIFDEKGKSRKDGAPRFLRLHEERLSRRKEELKVYSREKESNDIPPGFADEVRRLAALFPVQDPKMKPEKKGPAPKGRSEGASLDSPDHLREMMRSRRGFIIEGLEHLTQVHHDLISHLRQRGRLDPLKKTGYRYGNDFAEEFNYDRPQRR